jgi:hypothetical protein
MYLGEIYAYDVTVIHVLVFCIMFHFDANGFVMHFGQIIL